MTPKEDGTVYRAQHDPAWPSRFNQQKKQIHDAIGDYVLLLNPPGVEGNLHVFSAG